MVIQDALLFPLLPTTTATTTPNGESIVREEEWMEIVKLKKTHKHASIFEPCLAAGVVWRPAAWASRSSSSSLDDPAGV